LHEAPKWRLMALLGVIRKKPAAVHRLNIRLSSSVLIAVDAACGRRAGTVSRNTWIAEAVAEKLAREEQAKRSEGNSA
jgi:hypothetical protein